MPPEERPAPLQSYRLPRNGARGNRSWLVAEGLRISVDSPTHRLSRIRNDKRPSMTFGGRAPVFTEGGKGTSCQLRRCVRLIAANGRSARVLRSKKRSPVERTGKREQAEVPYCCLCRLMDRGTRWGALREASAALRVSRRHRLASRAAAIKDGRTRRDERMNRPETLPNKDGGISHYAINVKLDIPLSEARNCRGARRPFGPAMAGPSCAEFRSPQTPRAFMVAG